MRITGARAIPFSVPASVNSTSLGVFPTWDYALVLVETDEGLQGLGEASMIWDGGGAVQAAFVEEVFGPRLVGEDPTAINRCLRRLDTLVETAWPARAGVEMALYDLAGKAFGLPVYQLLGGRTREAVTLSRSVHMDAPARMAETAAGLVAQGFTCVKVKVGLDPERDLAAVAAVREAIGPGALLRADANMGWRSVKEAVRNIRRLERFDLHSIEQPVPRLGLEELRLLRESVDTPIMLDESVFGPGEAFAALAAGAADMLNVYVAESGGLGNAALIFRMAELRGVPCVIGSMPEFGIGTAAAVHLGVAVTNLNDPSDAAGAAFQRDDVVNERFQVVNGAIRPFEAPGLGVTLDWEAVERYRSR